jgi:hypothetical protein
VKLRIAAAALGLGGLLLVPATNGFGLTHRQDAQCTAAPAALAAEQAALANLPADATRARARLQARIAHTQAFIAAICR